MPRHREEKIIFDMIIDPTAKEFTIAIREKYPTGKLQRGIPFTD
jgi:hypothetical protein